MPLIEFKKHSLFTTGCCASSVGDITGLKTSDGEIRLLGWAEVKTLPNR